MLFGSSFRHKNRRLSINVQPVQFINGLEGSPDFKSRHCLGPFACVRHGNVLHLDGVIDSLHGKSGVPGVKAVKTSHRPFMEVDATGYALHKLRRLEKCVAHNELTVKCI